MPFVAVLPRRGRGYNDPMSNATTNRTFRWKLCVFAIALFIAAELNMFGLADFIRDYGQTICRIIVWALFIMTSLFLAEVCRKRAADSSGKTSG